MTKQFSLTEALDLLVPPFDSEPEAWRDVLRRAGHEAVSVARPARRLALLAAAVVVAIALAATAYAVGRHFFVGDPAPPEVTKQASLLQGRQGRADSARAGLAGGAAALTRI